MADDKDTEKEDVVYEDEAETSSPQEQIRRLREKLATCVQEKQEYLDGWQRIKAEFANSKKQEKEEKERFVKFAEENLLEELIPILDSFDMATGNSAAWEALPPEWRKGMEYVRSQLLATLEAHGLRALDPKGKPFDPREHAAVAEVPAETEEQDHTVAEVLQRGYTLSGKVLRPAQVKVYISKTDK
ncbi:MAG TPA: nucleotide exchange factor GrpE [Candidatus Paceibacterota bacterium]|nr:nucleotide exchange factor GrpE [Candidatus Paceibacterota bacterium]